MGIRGNITRTNLAYANENRDWRVYRDLAQVLIRKARRLYAAESHGLDIDEMVYALDSSTIDLCLSMFPWATFRQTKAAIKLHTLMDLRGSIPVFISITEGSIHDVNILDQIAFEAGSIYVMDRGYVDFCRLHRIDQARAFFVTRAKSNLRFYVSRSNPIDRSTGLRCDQVIGLCTAKSKTLYPEKLRRIRYIDPETGQSLTFITNQFEMPPLTIAAIYKSRWHIELFFKWIKQNLRIKAFYGTSINAVKTQIWIAICVYLMVACLNKMHGINENLSRILQVLSVNVFQKDPVNQLLAKFETMNENPSNFNQLMFNDF
jgi:transposase